MPRKIFIADITAAAARTIPGISNVTRGDDDGDVNFTFTPASGPPVEMAVLAIDVSGYPSENTFMIFTKSSDAPKPVNAALEDLASYSAGMRIPELLSTISDRLQTVLTTGSQESPLKKDDSSGVEMTEEDDGNEESEEEGYFDDFDLDDGPNITPTSFHRLTPQNAAILNRRIKDDLRAVKFAGFKLGIISGLKAESQTSLLSISIQASKLGLSQEALQAWDLEPHQYIVILIRFSAGYKHFESIISEPAKSHGVAFRIGLSNKYKPTVAQAHAAFTDVAKASRADENNEKAEQDEDNTAGFYSIFIGSSLNGFVNEQFVSLLKIRNAMGIDWDGAKRFFNDKQGHPHEQNASLNPHYCEESAPAQASMLPDVITGDHVIDNTSKTLSFPLITTQFFMRYLLQCTEFCLVCHDKIEGGFEALKPYVCNKPLCLYQYMSLGFGPSVEHEIITQPYVVDLLVNFCYTAARCQRLREYPTGMSLHVPPVTSYSTSSLPTILPTTLANLQGRKPFSPATPAVPNSNATAVEVQFDVGRRELLFEEDKSCALRNGDWVVVTYGGEISQDFGKVGNQVTLCQASVHYRVEDASLFPIIKLSDFGVTRKGHINPVPTIANGTAVLATPATTPPPPMFVSATITKYDQMFDDMDDIEKAETIVMLLETLPTIKELRSYLLQRGWTSEPSLRTWKERVSPAALGILRWIIASNRSCIVQVDICPGQTQADISKAKVRLDQKCSNVPNEYVQFRFAQGAPDKEQRFLNALRAQQANLNPQYPTLFAFHGSPIQNWHSIIRHGLDFKETLHGRAYGHGVYHAQDQSVSAGYAHVGAELWPGSDLNIASVMSLNEIVNCPQQFTSSKPYLVVQHIDWIQCRYLFVQTNNGGSHYSISNQQSMPTPSDSSEVEQDPKHMARTILNMSIGVPQCAVSVSRAFRASTIENPTPSAKRRKPTASENKLSPNKNTISDEDEMEDLVFLVSDEEGEIGKGKGKATEDMLVILDSTPKGLPKSMTDFIPNSLDQSSLPMLDPPLYATLSATMRLNRELQTILKIQKSTLLHELGWYIDEELISNVYQWIVELHSFEPILPLAKDMKAAGVSSIVLEMRFGKDYPHSPPFVRVIRPRFLPFMHGGGGHVTGGGAMCMELLTNSGWSAASSIESVLLQVRMAIMNLEPKPARLESQDKALQRDYGTAEAMDAYIRACRAHGWQIPRDFLDFSGGDSSSSQ